MNLQIVGEKSSKKEILVSRGILSQDPGNIALFTLREILSHCRLNDRFLALAEGSDPLSLEDGVPFAIVTDSLPDRDTLQNFRICICDYDGSERNNGEEDCRCTTFSTQWEEADFVAKNLHPVASGGNVFELEGLGIIGRVHLGSISEQTLRCVLIAAAAALSCGVSFAEVIEVLNQMATRSFHSDRAV